MCTIRKASHAGSWYTKINAELNDQLDNWLAKVDDLHTPARAIIAPHAGYSYCGDCAAYAYRQIDPSTVRRIFILGPSHHIHMPKCCLTSADECRTPLYNLTVDKDVCQELYNTGEFDVAHLHHDEDEHSIEMQLPFVAKVMERYKDQFKIVTIMVGSISHEQEQKYGILLSSYLANPENLFVISSDFCHWGKKFRYTYRDNTHPTISCSIQHLDRMGMTAIENLDPDQFRDYLDKYKNTICGRHPISVLLHAIRTLRNGDANLKMKLKFLKYKQSNACKNEYGFSVSYASASLCID